ncbi:hypothetical protein PIB30_079057, partial [Stylosanthes scabra]|nr:hypothetical protein [Stylosanthes scabra]
MELLEEMVMKMVLGCSMWRWNRLCVQVELGIQEVNKGIYRINFPAPDNSGLSVVKGCPRNTHVVKYRHIMITWKSQIIMIQQALGHYVASSGKYVLGVIRDIYWIGRRNHEDTEEEEENREQRKLESSYREPKLLQGNIRVKNVTQSK